MFLTKVWYKVLKTKNNVRDPNAQYYRRLLNLSDYKRLNPCFTVGYTHFKLHDASLNANVISFKVKTYVTPVLLYKQNGIPKRWLNAPESIFFIFQKKSTNSKWQKNPHVFHVLPFSSLSKCVSAAFAAAKSALVTSEAVCPVREWPCANAIMLLSYK